MEQLATHWDVIVLGTGLKECILSGLLSVEGKRVLHLDRNSYYGGASASLTLDQLYARFRGAHASPQEGLGPSREYNVDLVPKFIMAHGNLVKALVHTDVTKYLEFKAIEGAHVLSQGQVHKVPATDAEALASGLFGWVGIFEKRRARAFFLYVQHYRIEDPKTWGNFRRDLRSVTMAELYAFFALDQVR
jgi:Rab GDP dissociation inhibitor